VFDILLIRRGCIQRALLVLVLDFMFQEVEYNRVYGIRAFISLVTHPRKS
jgi:hypothetical protein